MAMNAGGSKKTRSGLVGRWLFWCVVVGGVAGVLVFHYGERVSLQARIESLRVQQKQTRRLLADNRSLSSQQPSTEELARLRSDREAISRLRGEVEALRKAAGRTPPKVSASAGKQSEPTMLDTMVPASAWRNVGDKTPEAVVETALWAAAGGEVELLAQSLILDTNARTKAEAILSGLPAETRAFYKTPELLMAFLTAKDIPSSGARILKPGPEAEGMRTVQLRDAGGQVRQAQLMLRQTAAGWRLVMPEEAVARHAAMLKD
jgi:hypothetical protein